MTKLSVDHKTIFQLFGDRKTEFLIPDYQRPYAWGEEECQTLWDDLKEFALPGMDKDAFDPDGEYFLGPIVTFKNEGRMEVIDGQQLLTTIMLLLRAFHPLYKELNDEESVEVRKNIERCVWKTSEFGKPIFDQLKIDSEVATDDDKEEFMAILRDGEVSPKARSAYARNYRFFQQKLAEFNRDSGKYTDYLAQRILANCILLPIEADSQETALRIFSTLNDRGKPLSDSDIFKAQMYRHAKEVGRKDEFVESWKALERLSAVAFKGSKDSPLDEVFTRYMYCLRARRGVKVSTTEALRKFYEADGYAALKDWRTMDELLDIAAFWRDVGAQDASRFDEGTLKRLSLLSFAPNSMWTYLVTVYYLANKDADGLLDAERFDRFLDRTTAFIFAYSITNPGMNSLRVPVFSEMVNVVNGEEATFADQRFDAARFRSQYANFYFHNNKPITRSMAAWWTYHDRAQTLLPASVTFEIEHIYPRRRAEAEPLSDPRNLESLGNKSLLEGRINSRASDYRFADKRGYYLGSTSGKRRREGTMVAELRRLAEAEEDFTEDMILDRDRRILDAFVGELRRNGLLLPGDGAQLPPS